MTTRHSGYLVTLAEDIREDDAQAVIAALGMVRGVLSVDPVESNPLQFIAEARRDAEWQAQLSNVILGMNR